MAKGGRRQGAGRPKGAQTERKRAVAIKAAAEGVTPITVMLGVMRAAFSEAIDPEGGIIDMKAATLAANMAKDAAPYVHPRLSSVDARVRQTYEDMTDTEIEQRIAELEGRKGRAADAPGGAEAAGAAVPAVAGIPALPEAG